MRWYAALGAAIGVLSPWAQAIDLDITDECTISGIWHSSGASKLTMSPASLIAANSQACDNAFAFYQGNQPGHIPGIPDPPYYWWEMGGMFGLLIQRWSITGNSSLNNLVTQGMQFQVGSNNNYEPSNQTSDLGNDDQVFWGFAAMDAAELNFPNPPSGDPSWISLAQAVFNRQTGRWDPSMCGGGMRWQIFPWNKGYNYKNAMTNGGYFQLAARLARYTGNDTYAQYAEKMYDWMEGSAMFQNASYGLEIWDGFVVTNCTSATKLFWSYNPATLLMGSAYMYNYTNGAQIWETRIRNLLQGMSVYFVESAGANSPSTYPKPGGQIMAEVACEFSAQQSCDQDEPSFKAFTSRWLTMTTVLAPFSQSLIEPLLKASAQAAAGQCTGTAAGQTPGTSCGRRWYQTTWDGFSGFGEQLSAMSIFQSIILLNHQSKNAATNPLTANTGGTSQGDAGAGNGGPSGLTDDGPWLSAPITTGDIVGASILTVLSTGLCIATSWFMIV